MKRASPCVLGFLPSGRAYRRLLFGAARSSYRLFFLCFRIRARSRFMATANGTTLPSAMFRAPKCRIINSASLSSSSLERVRSPRMTFAAGVFVSLCAEPPMPYRFDPEGEGRARVVWLQSGVAETAAAKVE